MPPPQRRERLDGFLATTAALAATYSAYAPIPAGGTECGITWRTCLNVTANLFDDP